jgi:L-threonylcarbamoyladenylate synthase
MRGSISEYDEENMTGKTTLRLAVDAAAIQSPGSRASLSRAAELLKSGATVAFPTETVYGLGANARDENAVSQIFLAKERPSWDPLIVHISDVAMLDQLVRKISPASQMLINTFWPGPLTLLLPRATAVPSAVTAGRDLVGVRMPAHPVAKALIAAARLPIAAPSANRFGRTSPTSAAHVLEDLDGRIDAVVDGGPTRLGVESTVVDASTSEIIIYRPGVITQSQIEALVGPVTVFRVQPISQAPEALPSPGVGVRHYAPRARLVLVGGDISSGQQLDLLREAASAGGALGVMLPSHWTAPPRAQAVYDWGEWGDCDTLAERLFAGLRSLDAQRHLRRHKRQAAKSSPIRLSNGT